jgi:hypothetical protein
MVSIAPLGEPWYYDQTLWTIAGVVAAVAAIATAFHVADTRGKLYIDLGTPAPVNHGYLVDYWQAHWKSPLLIDVAKPHVVVVNALYRGRRDIPATAFDCEEPLVFRLIGGRAVEILEVQSLPKEVKPPRIVVEDQAVKVCPWRIVRHQKVTITLLVEGSATLQRSNSPINDVDIGEYDFEQHPLWTRGLRRWIGAIVIGTLAALSVQDLLVILNSSY